MEKVKFPEKKKQPIKYLNKKARMTFAKAIAQVMGFKSFQYYFREDGIKDFNIKPLPLKERLLYSSSHHAIRTSKEGYDYARH